MIVADPPMEIPVTHDDTFGGEPPPPDVRVQGLVVKAVVFGEEANWTCPVGAGPTPSLAKTKTVQLTKSQVTLVVVARPEGALVGVGVEVGSDGTEVGVGVEVGIDGTEVGVGVGVETPAGHPTT